MDVHIALGSHICTVQHMSGSSHSEQMVTSEHSRFWVLGELNVQSEM